MKRTFRLGLAVATAAVSVIALAQTATPAKSAAEAKTVIEARQKVFEDMKKAYEPMTDMLKRKREFDAALVATNAAQIQVAGAEDPRASGRGYSYVQGHQDCRPGQHLDEPG